MNAGRRQLRERTLRTLEEVRADKERRLERGLVSNCGFGLPYRELRERLGVHGPLARLRFRAVVGGLTRDGLVRIFIAYDSAAGTGTAIELVATPAVRPHRLPAPRQGGYTPEGVAPRPDAPPPRPPDRPRRTV